ncbi:MAG: hypothetical protein WD009_04315 [Phycisphaeraceae bacterium]
MNRIITASRIAGPVLVVAAALLSAGDATAEAPNPLDDEARAMLAVPAEIVALGNEAPLIHYSRRLSGGAHTHGGWHGGWQITHALAVHTGDTAADSRMLEQVRHSLEGERVISANGGYPAQHERHMTGAYTILRHTPRFWNDQLTEDERHKIDLVMKASLIASAYTTADATYAGDVRHTALDGDRNLNRGWNPNFREGMIGGLLVATVYFGGVDAVYDILNSYDHDAFVDELDAAGLTNIHETFTWAHNNPDSDAPTAARIEHHVREYRYHGERLMEPMDLYHHLTTHTYGAEVACGLNDGQGIMQGDVPTGVVASGCEGLPNKGHIGMLHEFASNDASGRRSSMSYAYDGFRPNLTNHLVLLVGGYWQPGPKADEVLDRLDVGITDVVYKLEHGYRNYSHGRGSTGVFDINREHWNVSFRTTIPLWTQILQPFHEQWNGGQ